MRSPRTVDELARDVAESEVLGHVLIAMLDARDMESAPDDAEVARAIAAALRAAGLTDADLGGWRTGEPPDPGEYLVTYDASGSGEASRPEVGLAEWDGELFWYGNTVLAWRPLPDPPEEAEDA